jgi:hypothetical protein
MNATGATTQRSLTISLILLVIATGTFAYFIICLGHNKGEMSFVPFTAFLAAIFVWQLIALLRNRKSFVFWLLAILYGLALVPFVMELVRFPSARQLW